MRRIVRQALDEGTAARLRQLQAKVDAAPDPRKAAQKMWDNKSRTLSDSLQATLGQMAGGAELCMYCGYNEATDVDHFRPKSSFPSHTFSWENHLLACSNCNSNHKRLDFPIDEQGEPLLLDPTRDTPSDHLRYQIPNGRFLSIGPKGPRSIDVFDLNGDGQRRRRKLPQKRLSAWVALTQFVLHYDHCVGAGELSRAQYVREALAHQPFPFLWDYFITLALHPEGPVILGEDLCAAVHRHKLNEWTL